MAVSISQPKREAASSNLDHDKQPRVQLHCKLKPENQDDDNTAEYQSGKETPELVCKTIKLPPMTVPTMKSCQVVDLKLKDQIRAEVIKGLYDFKNRHYKAMLAGSSPKIPNSDQRNQVRKSLAEWATRSNLQELNPYLGESNDNSIVRLGQDS